MIQAVRTAALYLYGLLVALLWGEDDTYADDGGAER